MKLYLTALLAAGLSFASCSDFLTQEPKHALTQNNSVKNYLQAQHIVNGIYSVYEHSCSDLGGALYANLHCMAGMWQYVLEMYNMGYTQSKNSSSRAWQELYSCINAANAAISGVSALDDSSFPSQEAKEKLIAEARCFRGFCDLQLLWFYGRWFDKADSPYGIIYRDKVAEMSNLNIPRSSVGDSYKLILDDLKFAEEHLDDYQSAKKMSRQFAMVMHAKLLLVRGWTGDYEEALKIVNELLSESTAFAMETDLSKVYAQGWDSKEVLFSRYLGDLSNFSNGEFQYSYGLYYSKTFTDIPQQWLEEDPRRSVWLGNARSPETWDDSRSDDVLVKLYHRGRYEGPNDMYATYVFRYPELYLMKAELLARTKPDDIAGALAPLNEMRSKYTNPVVPPVTGITTHQELMDAIFKEYVVTLFMENETPWFASLRFEKNGKPWIYTLKPDVNFSQDQFCWPIPDEEIKAHTNKIEQNPGLE